MIKTPIEEYIVIELKYKTKKKKYQTLNFGEIELKNHAAQDLGRYDFIKDIERIEKWGKNNTSKKLKIGFAIFLTNDSVYRISSNNVKKQYKYKQFCLGDGFISKGEKNWENGITEKSCGKKRMNSISISNDYKEVCWMPELKRDEEGFQYLIVEIGNENQ